MKADKRAKLNSGKGTTLKQIAELAGCSTAVVSTVLNNSRGNTVVSEQTRQRVLDIARAQDYRPNLAAQSMKSRKSRIIGALVRNNSRVHPDEMHSHPLAWELVLGINEGLEAFGYMMSLVRLSDVDPEQHFQSSAFQGHLLDGLIVVNVVPAASEGRLKELVPHCVWLDSNVWHPENCIRRDEVHAGRTATQALIDLGYRDFICIRRPEGGVSHYSYAQRLQGVKSVVQKQGAAIEEVEMPWDDGYSIVPHLAGKIRRETAVIVLDTYAVQTLIAGFASTGIRPGPDFALACCDDNFPDIFEQVSRVSFDRFEMGQQAARMMTQILDNSHAASPSLMIKGQWIEGQTALPLTREPD